MAPPVSTEAARDPALSSAALVDQLRVAGAGSSVDGLEAAYTLAECGADNEGVVPLLLEVLAEQAATMEPDMQSWVPYSFTPLYNFHLPPAAQSLMALGGDAAASALSPLLDSSSWVLRVLAAEALGLVGRGSRGSEWTAATETSVARGLCGCLQYPHWWVRRSALQAAGRLGCDAVSSQLAQCAGDVEFLVRRNACLCVAQLCSGGGGRFTAADNGDLMRAVSVVLDDDDRYNRLYATVAMQRLAMTMMQGSGRGPAIERLFAFLLASRFDSDGKY
jgi:hypothetical protein|eukprot:COSAG01_NODE_3605_length_5879_cov_3.169377_3_plen_277_part_00